MSSVPAPTVMVIDDDAALRRLLRRMLSTSGFGVSEADSGRAALEVMRGGAVPDLLITDLRMEEGSGGWLLAQVGYEFPELLHRTVVVSGDAGGAAAAHVAARWRCPVVAKPFESATLISVLTRLLGDGPATRSAIA